MISSIAVSLFSLRVPAQDLRTRTSELIAKGDRAFNDDTILPQLKRKLGLLASKAEDAQAAFDNHLDHCSRGLEQLGDGIESGATNLRSFRL